MLPKEGIYPYTIDAYLSDFRGKATLPMLGGFMLQAATRHGEERNFGYSFMTSRQRAWVLMRMSIDISEYPSNDTTIKLHTWVADINKLFCERCFAFEDGAGNFIGYARTLWASIDMETRRPTNISDLDRMVQCKSDRFCPIANTVKIATLKECELAASFTVKYSDIDINKHLNSIKYIEHLVDVFPISLFQEKEIKLFEINYLAEGQYGTTLDILKNNTNENISVLEMKNNDKTICTARVTWQ